MTTRPPAAGDGARRARRTIPLLLPMVLLGMCFVVWRVISGHFRLADYQLRELKVQQLVSSGLPQEEDAVVQNNNHNNQTPAVAVSDDSLKTQSNARFETQVESVIQRNQTAEQKPERDEHQNVNQTAKTIADTLKNETTETLRKEPNTKERIPAREEKKEDTESAASNDATEEQKKETKKKPLNIVLLYADDMRHDSLGIAGTQVVETPYIDHLARKGIRFTHNCVTTAVCWISRATLYTGQYLSRHETTMPFTDTFYKDWDKSWPTLLHNAGYHVGHVGKWHHGDQRPIKPSYDFFKAYYGRHVMEDGTHVTKQNELDSLEFLQTRPKDKPFVLSTCFFAPHAWDGNPAVFVPQNASRKLYQDTKVPLPDSYTEQAWKDMPYFFTDRNEARTRFRQRFQTPELYQDMIKNYYRLISEVDYASGQVIRELERQGVLNETLVIFTTDNGFFHGEHMMAGKWYPHEESLRVPLVIMDPRIPEDQRGTTNDEFTLNVDLAETILGAAGMEAPTSMQGRDIADLYVPDAKDKTLWRQEFFYEHPVHLHKDVIPASTALVRKDFKYMTWPNFKVEQLFDMNQDPMELNDIINQTEHVARLEEIRTRHQELANAVGYKETFMTECCQRGK